MLPATPAHTLLLLGSYIVHYTLQWKNLSTHVALDVALGLSTGGLRLLLGREGDEAVGGALPAVLAGEVDVQHLTPPREVLPDILLRHLGEQRSMPLSSYGPCVVRITLDNHNPRLYGIFPIISGAQSWLHGKATRRQRIHKEGDRSK